MTIRDSRRHAQLNSSINTLQAKLKTNGIDATKTSGCGSAYSEFGPNMKACSISLHATRPTSTVAEANKFLNLYAMSLRATSRFNARQPVPESVVSRDGFTFGFATYYDKATKSVCGVDYDFDSSIKLTTIGISCNDKS
ncbi:MAG TPA: hypothetical protein VFL85_03625 [Candidatus Saccharimonadales bacterium]|nr:hypothetical protein [Candidatus Saccharimonadales bacterium]